MKLVIAALLTSTLIALTPTVTSSPGFSIVASGINVKQHCKPGFAVKEPKCSDNDLPTFKAHWRCCNLLTPEDEKKTAAQRAKEKPAHDKATDHGRCDGKAHLSIPKCTEGEFKHPRFVKNLHWDCCKSLTDAEEKRTGRTISEIRHTCHDSGYENDAYHDRPYISYKSCVEPRYAKKNPENISGWECCPELTDDEKRIGKEQREEALKRAISAQAAVDKANGEKDAFRNKSNGNKAVCEENHISNRKNNSC